MNEHALIECSPNFSEGRRVEVIEALVGAVESAGVKVLNVAPDAEHNRCVIQFAGPPAAVAQAALRATDVAVRLIDLNVHRGEHPRMGAVDVIPFVPIAGCDVADCVQLAREVGEAIGQHLAVPVFLYGEAATRPGRETLEVVRRGEFEGLRTAMGTDPDRAPDFGPGQIHPTAGATAVGARPQRTTLLVSLGTTDLVVAHRVAAVAEQALVGCKVSTIPAPDEGRVHLVVTIADLKKTPIHAPFELIQKVAAREQVPVAGADLLGLVPLDALVGVAQHFLRLRTFTAEQVLERRLMEG